MFDLPFGVREVQESRDGLFCFMSDVGSMLPIRTLYLRQCTDGCLTWTKDLRDEGVDAETGVNDLPTQEELVAPIPYSGTAGDRRGV
jgi:hypothetical protein